MMKRIFTLTGWAASVSLIVATGLATDKANYSGKYSKQLKAASGSDTSTLEVVQAQESIQITRVELGKTTTSRCPFDGSEGDYTSPGGTPGTCKVQLKPKYLVLESVVVTSPQPSGPAVRIRSKERWQLSPDGKSLTIKFQLDFPDAPADISAALSASGITKYVRTAGP